MNIMGEKFSYSKLSTYESCPYKYKIIYVDKHFVSIDSIATLFGSLVHYIEECIGNIIIEKGTLVLHNNEEIYDEYRNLFMTIDNEKEKLFGVNKLKEMFPDEFYEKDKNGLSYQDKVDYYLQYGIYRLRDYLLENTYIELVDTEKEFTFDYQDIIFHGFIDRLYYNNRSKSYIVEDIKTYSADIENKKLKAPLQMVVYTLALRDKEPDCKVECQYELPLIGSRQNVRNKTYLEIGEKEIKELLNSITEEEFIPNPTPLCHWCQFCPTNPNQPKEGKNLCPYYCKWTRQHKTMAVLNPWQGIEKDKKLVESLQGIPQTRPQVRSQIRINRRR